MERRPPSLSWIAAAAGALALLAGISSAAAAPPVPLGGGQAGNLPWQLSVQSKPLPAGAYKLPGVCVSFLWAWGPGQQIGNGFPSCVAPARGVRTRTGLRWTFDLHATSYDGAIPLLSGGSLGPERIRGIVVLVDPRARRAAFVLSNGERAKVPARAIPGPIGRVARIAYVVDQGASADVKVVAVTARNGRGVVVGSYRPSNEPRRR